MPWMLWLLASMALWHERNIVFPIMIGLSEKLYKAGIIKAVLRFWKGSMLYGGGFFVSTDKLLVKGDCLTCNPPPSLS